MFVTFIVYYLLLCPFLWTSAERNTTVPLDIVERMYYQRPGHKPLRYFVENIDNLSQIFSTYPTVIKENQDIGTRLTKPTDSADKRSEEEASNYINQLDNQDDVNNEVYIDKASELLFPTEIKPKFEENIEFERNLMHTPKLRFCLLSNLYSKNVCTPEWSNKKSFVYIVKPNLACCNNLMLMLKFLNSEKNHRNLFSILQNTNFDYSIGNDLNLKNNVDTKVSVFKRLPFKSWGGKRFNQVGTEKVQTSKVPFNAWGGKRSYHGINFYSDTAEVCKRSKTKFYSWGGKKNAGR